VGTPVIALFSSASPAKSAKRWGPWDKCGTVIEKPALADITVEEVLAKIREKL
jgi:ADP-heptose:LPS heptosyltransferase